MAIHKVLNKETGLVHTVNDGHYSLDSPEFEVLPEEPRRKQRKKVVKKDD